MALLFSRAASAVTNSLSRTLESLRSFWAAIINEAVLPFEELIPTASSSAVATARSITETIPASFSFLAVVGPIPSISWISNSTIGEEEEEVSDNTLESFFTLLILSLLLLLLLLLTGSFSG